MKKSNGYTIIELLTIIFIVLILAAIIIPILRGQIDSARWAEGRTMAGTIAEAIRTYIAGITLKGGNTDWNEITLPYNTLGFVAADLKGTYFDETNFTWDVVYDGVNLTYEITIHRPDGISSPEQIVLNESGDWID